MEGATAIAYGARRLDALGPRAFDPSLTVIAPHALWELSHADKLAYARARNIHVVTAAEGSAAASANLWGRYRRELRAGWTAAAQDIGYALTRPPLDCPDEPAYLDIEFEAGVPVRANGDRDDAARDDREPRDDRRRARRRPIERSRAAPAIRCRASYRGAGSRRAAHGASRAGALVIRADLDRVKRELARIYADLVQKGAGSR